VGILLLLPFGPWAFNRLTSFVKSQIDAALNKPVAVHYHQLDIRCSAEDLSSIDAERAAVGLQFSNLAADTEPSWFRKLWRYH
jgi:vomeronasal1 receptor